ncbi:MAG: hypothetical protein HUU01_06165 [Saprospiraceae bacterium]|nr:hypothetical protein [Saprospiraceae bacterium]
MAKRSITSVPPGDENLEIFLQRYTAVVQLLRDKKGSLTALPFGLQYFEAFESLEPFLGKLNVIITDHDTHIAELDELLRQAQELLDRLKQLDLENLDPEKIRQKVLDALASWKNEVDRLIAALQDQANKHEQQLASIEATLRTIDPAQIEQNAVRKVLGELAAWRDEVRVALGKFQDFIKTQEPLVRQLRTDVDALMAKIAGVDFSKLTPEAITRAVLDALKDWKNALQTQVDRLNADVITLRDDLARWKASAEQRFEQLKQRLDAHDLLLDQAAKRATAQDLRMDQLTKRTDAHDTLFEQLGKRIDAIIASGGGDPEKVKELVLKALESWKKSIDDSLLFVRTELSKHGTQLFEHGRWIITLQEQVRGILNNGTPDPAAIKAAVLEALKGWQSMLQQQLDELKKRQDGDDNRWIEHRKSLDEINNRIAALAGTIPNIEGLRAEMLAIRTALQTEINNKTKTVADRLSENIQRIDKEIQRLDERINGIETTGVDPEEVRKIIEKELSAWRQEIQNSINQLTRDLIQANTRIDGTIQRIEKLEKEGLTEQGVKDIVNALLIEFKAEGQRALDLISEKITGVNTRLTDWIAQFDKRLTTDEGLLSSLTEEIRLLKEKGVDEAGIKIIFENWIKEWETKVNEKITASETLIRQLIDDKIRELLETVRTLIENSNNTEEIAGLILERLKLWREQVGLDIAQLKETDRLTGIAIGNLDQAIKNLEIRINNIVISVTPEDVKKEVEAALESWQRILQNLLAELRREFEDELNELVSLREQVLALKSRIETVEGKDWTTEVLKALESWKQALEGEVALVRSLANDALNKIEGLALEDGLIGRLNGQLEVLRSKVNSLPDEARVKQLIDEAVGWLKAWKETVDQHLQAYGQDKMQFENRLTALGTTMTKADEEIRALIGAQKKELEAQLKKQEERLSKVEERIARDDHDDQAFVKATNQTLGQLKAKDDQLEAVNAAQQAQIEALIEQVDAWKPDAGNETADRLARRCLVGRGIACGFEVWHTKKYTLYIAPGAGVTSDGHLLTKRDTTHYTHFRILQNRDRYPLFVKRAAKKQGEKPLLYDAWELVPIQDDEKGCMPLSPQKLSDEPFLLDKVVLALMPEESDGTQLTYVIMRHTDVIEALHAKKRLDRRLAERPDADFVFEEDFAPNDEMPFEEDLYLALHPVLALKEIPLPRFGFFNNRECSPEELDQTEFPVIDASGVIYKTYAAIIEDVLRKVDRQMGRVIDQYHALLFPQLQKKEFEQALNRLDEKWTAYKKYSEKSTGTHAQCYVQYFYDWARDLLAAYHELRSELQQLTHACCVCDDHDPMTFWHPRHLLLGLAMRTEHNGLSSPLRNEMQQPPVYNSNAARLESSRLYFRRWFFMVKFFFLPIHEELEKNPLCKDNKDELNQEEIPDFSVLRITPGKTYQHPISFQSLPFYYAVSPGSQSLHRFWNYQRSKTVSENQLLSYHAHDGDDSYSSLPHVVRPLYFSLDAHDFYRIEGHIGKKTIAIHRKYGKDDVPATYDPFAALQYLIQKHNLDFEVISIPYTALQKAIEGMPPYLIPGDDTTKVWSFARNLLGAEHLAGVPKGGTFLLITEGEGTEKRVIADFCLPYRCQKMESPPPVLDTCTLAVSATADNKCVSDQINATITVKVKNPGSDKFDLFVDEVKVGTHLYGQGGVTEVVLPIKGDGILRKIKAQDSINKTCEATVDLKPVRCACDMEVSVKSITPAELRNHVKVLFEILVDSVEGRQGFTLQIDREAPPAMVPYRGKLTTVERILPIDEISHTVVVKDAFGGSCGAENKFLTNRTTQ